MDPDLISETLDAMADRKTAKATQKNARTIRGVRGTPMGEIARIAGVLWDDGVKLDEDEHALRELFSTAFEDGLVAIGLAAACTPDDPEGTLDLGLDWLGRVDDTTTADALGWLVLGPAALATGTPIQEIVAAAAEGNHPARRRTAVAVGMAFTGAPIEGPSAAPLRARMKQKRIAFVSEPMSDALAWLATTYVRDDAPEVRKALRRLLREWAKGDPEAVVTWWRNTPGGIHKMLRAEVDKAARRAKRRQQAAAEE